MNYRDNRWRVEWGCDMADDARRSLLAVGDQPVRCGYALWRVVTWQELSGGRVGAILTAVDVHSLSPAVRLLELPMPDEAHR